MNDTVNLRAKYDLKDFLTKEDMKDILSYSKDKDECVRSEVASLLCNFENKKVQNILMELAQDEDELVRTEAYDSLRYFTVEKVERFLKKAILNELDELACSYAIMSWADISYEIHMDTSRHYRFISNLQKRKKIQKSERCQLECCYARYLLRKNDDIAELLAFLNSEDYHIRCSVLAILEIINCENAKKLIQETIQELLQREEIQAVKEKAKQVLESL